MKHTVKSIAPFAFFVMMLFLAAPPARADVTVFGRPYEFTLSAGPGFMYGTAYEIVYNAPGSDDYLSELQWNIKPLLFFGLDLEFGPKNPLEHWGLFASLGLKAGLPMETGVIEDRDWMSGGAYLPYCEVPGSLTHFSSHENHTKAAFMANLNTGISLPVRKLVLKFYLNVDYRYFSWEARNGYTQYGKNDHEKSTSHQYVPWNSSFEKDYSRTRGLGISYVQHWFLFTNGIGGEISLGRFTFSADVFFGIPLCITIDDHHLRAIRFTGVMMKGFTVKPELGVSFSLSERFDIGLFAAYVYSKVRGDTYIEEQGKEAYWTEDAEGARFKAFEGSLTLSYHL